MRTSLRFGERVALAARAWDSAGRSLTGKALRWTSRGRLLGSAVPIPARDRAGRTGEVRGRDCDPIGAANW